MDTKYLKASDGTGNAVLAHVTANRAVGSVLLEVDDLDNWADYFIATVGTVDSSGYVTPETTTEFRGRKEENRIVIEGFEPGYEDKGNSTDQVVMVKQTTGWANAVAANLGSTTDTMSDAFGDGVVDGGVVFSFASPNLNGVSSPGVAYIGGQKVTVPSVTRTFAPSKKTYIYIKNDGGLSFIEVGVNDPEPTTPSNTIFREIVTTDASKKTGSELRNSGVVKSENIDFATSPSGNWRRFGNTYYQTKVFNNETIVPMDSRDFTTTAPAGVDLTAENIHIEHSARFSNAGTVFMSWASQLKEDSVKIGFRNYGAEAYTIAKAVLSVRITVI